MANQMQLLIYEGYLKADPVMRYLENGREVTNFTIGSNRKHDNKDGAEVKETTWLKVTAWGNLAKIVNTYCTKGSHVFVTGRLRVGENGSPNVYQLKTGEWAASYEVTADEVRIIMDKKDTKSEEEVPDGEGPLPY